MPYQVTCPEDQSVSVLKLLNEVVDQQGNVVGYDHYAEIHYNGDVIADDDLSPVTRYLFEQGDPTVTRHFKFLSDKEADKAKTDAAAAKSPAPAASADPQAEQVERARGERDALTRSRSARKVDD